MSLLVPAPHVEVWWHSASQAFTVRVVAVLLRHCGMWDTVSGHPLLTAHLQIWRDGEASSPTTREWLGSTCLAGLRGVRSLDVSPVPCGKRGHTHARRARYWLNGARAMSCHGVAFGPCEGSGPRGDDSPQDPAVSEGGLCIPRPCDPWGGRCLFRPE